MISLAGGAQDAESRMSAEVGAGNPVVGRGSWPHTRFDVDRGRTGGPTSQRFKVRVLLVSAVSHQEQARRECRLAEPIMPDAGRWPLAVVRGGRNSGIGRTDPDRILAPFRLTTVPFSEK